MLKNGEKCPTRNKLPWAVIYFLWQWKEYINFIQHIVILKFISTENRITELKTHLKQLQRSRRNAYKFFAWLHKKL